MSTKQKQVTDNIHGTIYLSEMESEFIATPYSYFKGKIWSGYHLCETE